MKKLFSVKRLSLVILVIASVITLLAVSFPNPDSGSSSLVSGPSSSNTSDVSLNINVILGIPTAKASCTAMFCNWCNTGEECRDCCYERLEDCIDDCAQLPPIQSMWCASSCLNGYSYCDSLCVY